MLDFELYLNSLIIFLSEILFMIVTLFIIFYIFGSIGLMKISKNTRTKGSWIAWVPFFNTFLIGKIAYDSKLMRWLLLLLSIAQCNVTITLNEISKSYYIVPYPYNFIVSILFVVFYIICLHEIYKVSSRHYIILTLFTILSLSLLSPIFLFAIRNKIKPNIVPDKKKKDNTVLLKINNILNIENEYHILFQSCTDNIQYYYYKTNNIEKFIRHEKYIANLNSLKILKSYNKIKFPGVVYTFDLTSLTDNDFNKLS